MEKLESQFSAEFNEAALIPWQTITGGKIAGQVKSAGGGGFTGEQLRTVDFYQRVNVR